MLIVQFFIMIGTECIKFKCPATIIVAGQSGSGKSTWVARFIKDNMFDVPPKMIFYLYGVWNKQFDDMKNVEFHHGLPESFEKFYPTGNDHNLLIIDDLQVKQPTLSTKKL